MSHAVVVIDETQRVVLFNRGAEAMFGYAAGEVIGKPLDVLLPEAARAAHRRQVQGFAAATDSYRAMAGRPEIQGRRRDGTLFPAQAALSKTSVDGHTYMAAVVYDLSDQHALHAALDVAGARHGTLFTQTPVGLVFIDTEGTSIDVNPTAAVLLGYPREELVGLRFNRITHPDDVDVDRQMLGRVLAGDLPFYARQKRYLRQDGTTFWADVTVAPLPTADGEIRHLVVLIEDSSTQRRLELDAIVEKAVNEIYVFDAETLRFLYANESACANLGYGKRELEALTPLDLKPEFTPRSFAALLQPLRNGDRRQIDFTTYHRRKDGSRYDVQVRLQQTSYSGRSAFLAVIEDITERKRRDEALGEKTEQLRLVADVLSSFLATGDLRQANRQVLASALQQSQSEYGFIGIVHGTALRILDHQGIEWNTDTNRDFYECALATYREKGYLEFTNFDNLFGAVLVTGKPVLSNDPAHDPRAGGLPPGHPPLRSFLGMPMTSGDEVVGMIGVANRPGGYGPVEQEKLETLASIATVLYDNHRRAQRQAQIEEQLHQAQKMEAVGQLTGGIAHDFNNLLQVILGNVDILEEEFAEGSDARRAADRIKRAGERAAQLTQQLLAFARRQPLAPAPVALAALIDETLPFLERTLGEDIDIRVERPSAFVTVLADPTQLHGALLNLAINARDAMPRGGILTLAADTIEIDARAAAARGIAPGSYGRLRVADTGSGMPPEVQAKAFEPFFTTKEVGRGTGLGLSMVYGFAKQSGGHAEIESAPGRGTTVTILLPRSEPDSSAETVPAEAADPLAAEPATILVVEDDAMVRSVVLDQIRSLGYTAVEAEDGPSALARLAEMPHIDLLFTDLVMPGGLNGKELAEKARQARPGLKVLFTSGYPSQSAAQDGHLDAQVRLLAKPYRMTELARALRQCLAADRSGS